MLAAQEGSSPRTVTLRPFQQTDLAAAHALDQLCFLPSIAYSRPELRYFVSRSSAYAVVAETGISSFAGFLVAGHNPRQTPAVAHIVTLDVHPTLRRVGIASALMQEAMRHYLDLAVEALELEVAVDNPTARMFYRKHGFSPVAIVPGYYNGVLDALTMRKSF